MSLAPRPWTRAAVDPARAVALRRDGVEVAGEQHRGVAAGRRARRCRRGRARARPPPRRTAERRGPRAPPPPRDSEGMSTSSSVRAARRSPRSPSLAARASLYRPPHALLRHRRLGQAGQPAARARCTSGAPGRRPRARRDVLRARHASSRSRARSRASGAARPSSPSTRRPATACDLLAAGAPLRARARAARRPLRADAGLRRAAVPPRAAAVPGPAAGQRRSGWEEWIARRLRAVRGADRARPATGRRRGRRGSRPVGDGRAAPRPPVRDLPGRDLLRAARPPAVAQAHAVGPAAADRRAEAARASSTRTAGSGTARSTSSTPARPRTPPTGSPPGSAPGWGTRRRA